MHEVDRSQNIDRLKDSLRAREGQERVSRETPYHFLDPSDAYAALSETLDAPLDDPSVNSSVIEDVRQGLAEFKVEHDPQIRPGIQGTPAVVGCPELDSAGDLRDLYCQTVCDFTDVNATFACTHEKYGDVGFSKATDLLFNTLDNDLTTDVSNVETIHLESVHATLEQVRLLQNTYVQREYLL